MRYTIKSGDTLWDLARKYGTTVDELMRMNPHIQDRNKIYAGRALQLPDPPSRAEQAPSSPVSANSQEAAPTGIPAPQPLPILPPLFPNMPSAVPSPVQQDAAAAAKGMDPGAMDPTQLALFINPLTIPRMIMGLAKMAPPALPQAGRVALGPTASNVMPIQGSQGVAKMLLNQAAEQKARADAIYNPMTWRDLLYKYPVNDEHEALRAAIGR